MLIKLTSLVNPEMDTGKPSPCYIDVSRILHITRSMYRFPNEAQSKRNYLLKEKLWEAAEALKAKISDYVPDMDNPVAVKWLMETRALAQAVSNAYAEVNRTPHDAYHPPQACTEIQLACGTALEHGVMLARLWVTESPEEVAELVQKYWLGSGAKAP